MTPDQDRRAGEQRHMENGIVIDRKAIDRASLVTARRAAGAVA